MINKPMKTGLSCKECDYELLTYLDKVFCPNCENPDGTKKQVIPNG